MYPTLSIEHGAGVVSLHLNGQCKHGGNGGWHACGGQQQGGGAYEQPVLRAVFVYSTVNEMGVSVDMHACSWVWHLYKVGHRGCEWREQGDLSIDRLEPRLISLWEWHHILPG